jgi:hypothetical protein
MGRSPVQKLGHLKEAAGDARPPLEEYHLCVHLQLTLEEPELNLLDPTFGRREDCIIGDDGNILRRETPPMTSCEIMHMASSPCKPSILLNGKNILLVLDSQVKVLAVNSFTWVNNVTPEQLSKHWNIGLGKAKKTLMVTTQRGTRMVAFLSLDARFWTNNWQLQYRHLNTALYTNTMFASTVSTHGNSCAQIFVNDLK